MTKDVKKNEQDESVNPITRDNILSLDIAIHCGYYSTHEAGTWNFTQRANMSVGEQYQLFYKTIETFVKKHDIKLIIAEDVNVKGQFVGMRKLSEFRGILYYLCAQLGLPDPKFINVKTVKKWATGDGNADKKKMMEYCVKRWGIAPIDDNMADAVHIFKHHVRMYRL